MNDRTDQVSYAAKPPWVSNLGEANRRRLRVFVMTLLAALVAGLGYTFLRPAEYLATARIQLVIPPASAQGAEGAVQDARAPQAFLNEVEVLTSRPLLALVQARLEAAGASIASDRGDALDALQKMVSAKPLEGTQVVLLSLRGGRPDIMPAVASAWYEAYREHLARKFQSDSGDAAAGTREQARALEAAVTEQRKRLEAFKTQHNIVSVEREENQVLARLRGASTSLNTANERVVTAESHLRSFEASIAAGKAVLRARDNPTLANLEQRVSQTREELRDMERNFTPEYLTVEPRARSLRVRLADLEEQIKQVREDSQQAALAEAEEELRSARDAAARIERQIGEDRAAAQLFTARFNEYKAMHDQLANLEEMHRAAVDHAVRLEAGRIVQTPSVQLIEPAVRPREPWRPLYARDAALSVAAALALALFATWLVGLFNRTAPQPAVVVAQPWIAIPPTRDLNGQPAALKAGFDQPALPAVARLPRELTEAETTALMRAADEEDRLALAALLSGLAADELVALRWRDVIVEKDQLHVPGQSSRIVRLDEPLRGLLRRAAEQRQPAPDSHILGGRDGQSAEPSDLGAIVLCAAHDGGLDRAADVTPAALRHTYIAFLVRQGIRFADLGRVVGRLPVEVLAAYSDIAAAGQKRPFEDIDRIVPALRRLFSA